MIAMHEVSKRFQVETVLDSIDMHVETGDFVALLGPSGCGKSTLLRLIAGLESPTSGAIELTGADRESTAQPKVAFVFQEPNLLPWRSVRRNVGIPFELETQTRSSATAQLIDESLSLVGLTSQDADKLPRQLSGGMKMRVSLARALVTHPEIMLMDEPFAALDDILRQQLNEDVVRIWRMQNWTTVFVTHNVSEAVFLSRRILVMGRHPGKVVREFDVPFGSDRPFELRSTPEFAQVCGEVGQALRESAQ